MEDQPLFFIGNEGQNQDRLDDDAEYRSQNRRRLFLENEFYRKWLGSKKESTPKDDATPLRTLINKFYIKQEKSEDSSSSIEQEGHSDSPENDSIQTPAEDKSNTELNEESKAIDIEEVRRKISEYTGLLPQEEVAKERADTKDNNIVEGIDGKTVEVKISHENSIEDMNGQNNILQASEESNELKNQSLFVENNTSIDPNSEEKKTEKNLFYEYDPDSYRTSVMGAHREIYNNQSDVSNTTEINEQTFLPEKKLEIKHEKLYQDDFVSKGRGYANDQKELSLPVSVGSVLSEKSNNLSKANANKDNNPDSPRSKPRTANRSIYRQSIKTGVVTGLAVIVLVILYLITVRML